MAIVRRLISTMFRASSTPVLRMLMTMLLVLMSLITAALRLCRSFILSHGGFAVRRILQGGPKRVLKVVTRVYADE